MAEHENCRMRLEQAEAFGAPEAETKLAMTTQADFKFAEGEVATVVRTGKVGRSSIKHGLRLVVAAGDVDERWRR